MSNDKKTLADVQPGGMVRLGDAAPTHDQQTIERVAKAMQASEQAQSGWTWADCSPIEVEGWMDLARAAVAALSAQPSPGGQGDALAAMDRLLAHVESLGASQIHPDYVQDARTARAALAARQPVCSTCDGTRVDPGGLPVCRDCVGIRQPVGEPVAEIGTVYGLFWYGADPVEEVVKRHGLKPGDLLYAAPPAQAVGLDAVRALLQRRIEQWRSHLPADPGAPGTREIATKGEHDYSNDVRIYREGIAVMEEVLAMTDSQAVGNG